MKKKKEPYEDWKRISKQIEKADEELLRMLDEDELDEDEEFDNRIAIPYTPIHPKPEPEKPQRKGSAIVGLICIIFFIALGYTMFIIFFKRELNPTSLTITLVSFIIIEIVNWKRKKDNK